VTLPAALPAVTLPTVPLPVVALPALAVAALLVGIAMTRAGPAPAPPPDHRPWPHRAGEPSCPDARRPGSPCAATATTVRVVDGDTVILRMHGRRSRVRLIGVDAPETWLRHDCFGIAATGALRRLVPPASAVRVVADAEPRDPYGRLLLYLWTSHGTFVNAALVREGFARTMTISPNTSRVSVFQEAERTARRAHAGMWRACP
jgi:micrococcal nuclease